MPSAGPSSIAEGAYPCVIWKLEAWEAFKLYVMLLERQAKAMCLALGWDQKTCKAE